MRNLCDQLEIQAKNLIKKKAFEKEELSINEVKAIQRISRISEAIYLAKDADVKTILDEHDTLRVSENIRRGLCDGDPAIYQKLYKHAQSKLELISPESLKGYVGLLD